jgi:carbon-monoxide dehydrogenase medium subunit
MQRAEFELLEPHTIQEAIQFLVQYGGEAKIIAGGTDLLIEMKQRTGCPKYLISLLNIGELTYIRSGSDLRIGSMTTIREIEKSPMIRKEFSILSDAVDQFASIQIRNMATIGGNLCNGAPSADTATPLIALRATVKVKGQNGERVVPVESFFLGSGKVSLGPDEILSEIMVPSPSPHSGGAYIKLMRRHGMDLPIIGVSVQLSLDQSLSICKDITIALGVVGPIPVRVENVEAMMRGQKIGDDLIERAGASLREAVNPRDSMRSSAEYRKDMISVLFKRAMKRSLERIERRAR